MDVDIDDPYNDSNVYTDNAKCLIDFEGKQFMEHSDIVCSLCFSVMSIRLKCHPLCDTVCLLQRDRTHSGISDTKSSYTVCLL